MSDVEAVLALAFLASNVFWAWNSHVLMNKLMSRNYLDYKVADLQKAEKPKKINATADVYDDMGPLSDFVS
jgi:hypothetical protein